MESIPVYHFGCAEKGQPQELFTPDGKIVINLEKPQFPFSWDMLYDDFCHTEKREIGEMTLIQVYGWTALSFWDNTTRFTSLPNSTSFIAPGTYTLMGILDLVVKHFPEIYRRVLPILKIREPSNPAGEI